MTPFELSLQGELHSEKQRFERELLPRWPQIIAASKTAKPERRRGLGMRAVRLITPLRAVFWRAMDHYLRAQIEEAFRQWDQNTRAYPHDLREASLDRLSVMLRDFVNETVMQAIATDQRLHGGWFRKSDVPRIARTVQHDGDAVIARLARVYEKRMLAARHASRARTRTLANLGIVALALCFLVLLFAAADRL